MFVISVVGQKGGVGKTTVSVNLSAALVEMGYSVLLVDADPQASTQDWFLAGEGEGWPTVTATTKPILHKSNQIRSMTQYDYIVIDTPPQLGELITSALLCSDLAILPISPSRVDLAAISITVGLCEKARAFNDNLQTCLLVSRKQHGTIIGREIRKSLRSDDLEDLFPLLKSEVTLRVAVAESPSDGQTIFTYDPKGKAAREFRRLASEVLQFQIEKEAA